MFYIKAFSLGTVLMITIQKPLQRHYPHLCDSAAALHLQWPLDGPLSWGGRHTPTCHPAYMVHPNYVLGLQL